MSHLRTEIAEYRRACRPVFQTKAKADYRRIEEAHRELKNGYHACSPVNAVFMSFDTFLACNDLLPLIEIRAELRM